jgi:hypothetical protein
MATLLDRYRMRDSTELRQRLNQAVWDKAASVLLDSASTTTQKQTALTRVKRVLSDHEHLMLVQFLGGFPGSDGVQTSDAVIVQAVDAIYGQIPNGG